MLFSASSTSVVRYKPSMVYVVRLPSWSMYAVVLSFLTKYPHVHYNNDDRRDAVTTVALLRCIRRTPPPGAPYPFFVRAYPNSCHSLTRNDTASVRQQYFPMQRIAITLMSPNSTATLRRSRPMQLARLTAKNVSADCCGTITAKRVRTFQSVEFQLR